MKKFNNKNIVTLILAFILIVAIYYLGYNVGGALGKMFGK